MYRQASSPPSDAISAKSDACVLRHALLAAQTIVVVGSSFNSITADVLVSAVPAMARDFGAGRDGAFLAQMMLVAPSISIIVGAPFAGYLVRWFSVRSLMLFCTAVYAIAGCYGAIAPDHGSLVASRLILGLMSGTLGTVALAGASAFGDAKRAQLLGYSNALAATVAIVSFVAGGVIAELYGWQAANLLYFWPVLLIHAILRGTPAERARALRDVEVPRGRFPLMLGLPIYLFTLLTFILIYSSSIIGPFEMTRRGLTNPSLIGVAVSGSALLCVVIATFYGPIARTFGTRAQLLILFGCFIASGLVMVLTTGVPAAVVGIAIGGIGGGILQPLLVSLLLRRMPEAHVTTAMGLFVSTLYLSLFCAPVAFRLVRAYTPFSPYGAVLVAGLTGFVLLLAQAIGARIKRSPALAPAA